MANKWKPLTMLLLMCAALVIGGCKDKEKPKAPGKPGKVVKPKPKVAGPRDVALTVLKATITGDGAAAAACADCSEEDKAFMKKMITIMGKMQAFATAGLKAYGKDAWEAAAKKAGMEDMAQPPMPSIAEIEKGLKCKVEGDKAICTMEGLGEPMELVKKGGKWLAVTDDLPPKAERENELKMISMMGDAMAEVTGKIGKPGVKADQVFEELSKAVQKAAGPPPTE